jgi:putative colanic acid biosynthesis UDP-glucose lipid carrier transferase
VALASGGAAAAQAPQAALRRTGRMAAGRDRALDLLEMALEPLALVAALWGAALLVEGRLSAPHMILALVVFSLSFPGEARLRHARGRAAANILTGWLLLAALLAAFGHVTGYAAYFDPDTLAAWAWAAPCCQAAAHFALRAALPALQALRRAPQRAVFAGMNAHGLELARRLGRDVYSNVRVLGFVDDRAPERLAGAGEFPLLARIDELPQLVKRRHIALVYIALPMVPGPRLRRLLEALRDTTASVHFVPDLFVTDLIQGRIDAVSGMPVLVVCDSPFSGLDGLVKRASDVVLAAALLAVLSPLLLALALGVRLSSPGPVIFRQRRYGLDGEQIVVYKFRTMSVTEDGATLQQCTHGDARVTRFGAFMRRASLDELPQLVNVLQGRMSLVGPRPHAVAHNELYRKLIDGYMLRHKVRPGLTGWAQVNGLRGETRTLERMQARIDHDLDYLRNWSLHLDLYIMARTLWVVLKGENAH